MPYRNKQTPGTLSILAGGAGGILGGIIPLIHPHRPLWTRLVHLASWYAHLRTNAGLLWCDIRSRSSSHASALTMSAASVNASHIRSLQASKPCASSRLLSASARMFLSSCKHSFHLSTVPIILLPGSCPIQEAVAPPMGMRYKRHDDEEEPCYQWQTS